MKSRDVYLENWNNRDLQAAVFGAVNDSRDRRDRINHRIFEETYSGQAVMSYGQGNYCYSAIPSAPVLSPITSTNVVFEEKRVGKISST